MLFGSFLLQTLLGMKPFKTPMTIRNNRKGCIETRTFIWVYWRYTTRPFNGKVAWLDTSVVA